MTDLLERAPLVEVLCEFQFDPDSNWSWIVPGRLYDRLADEFPVTRYGTSREFEVRINQGRVPAVIEPRVPTGFDRVRMVREDDSAVIQVGPHLLVVNHFNRAGHRYPGHKQFISLVMRVLNEYLEISGEAGIIRIGLRYINHLPIITPEDRPLFDLGSITTFDPPIPAAIANPLRNFHQRYEILYSDIQSVLIHQTAFHVDQEGKQYLALDLDCFIQKADGVTEEATQDWLYSAHGVIKNAFDASIQPDVLAEMKRGLQ